MPWVDVAFEDIEIGDVLNMSDPDGSTMRDFKVGGILEAEGSISPTLTRLEGFRWRHWSDRCTYQKWVGEVAPPSTFESELDVELAAFKAFLMAKNKKYGNSALEPVRVFSSADAREQLRVRMDDKLNRIMNKNEDEDEDVMKDLVGYWFLERILERRGEDNEKDM